MSKKIVEGDRFIQIQPEILTKYVTLCKITLSEKLLKKFMKKKLKNSFPQFINVLKGDEGLMNSDLFFWNRDDVG